MALMASISGKTKQEALQTKTNQKHTKTNTPQTQKYHKTTNNTKQQCVSDSAMQPFLESLSHVDDASLVKIMVGADVHQQLRGDTIQE